ncbi:hypothetical protein [Aquisphaera insulae]|uniref:hypothetical protein n=1 Tax=Aquisphaera insulae TaxID=2712864 RepID=UPI0013EBD824|nr:hypothetical protein [Aquisphaera insulae]
MRPSTKALTTTILGAALAAQTVSAQQSPPSSAWRRDRDRAAAATEPTPSSRPDPAPTPGGPDEFDTTLNMAATRGARYLLRNGLDYINYQEYERALKFLREAEVRQRELSEPEKRNLKQAIERAQRGLREAAGAETPYAVSRRSGRSGGFAPAKSATQLAAASVPGETRNTSTASKEPRPAPRKKTSEGDDQGQPIRLAGAETVEPPPANADRPEMPAMLPLGDESAAPSPQPAALAARPAAAADDLPAVAGSGTVTPPPPRREEPASSQPRPESLAAAEPATAEPAAAAPAPASEEVSRPAPEPSPGPRMPEPVPLADLKTVDEAAKPAADANAIPAAAEPAPSAKPEGPAGPAPAPINLEPPSDPAPRAVEGAAPATPAAGAEELPSLPLGDPVRTEPKAAELPSAVAPTVAEPAPASSPLGDELPQLPLRGASENAAGSPAPKPEEPKADAPKPEEPKADAPKPEEPKADAPKPEPVPAIAAATAEELPALPRSTPGPADEASRKDPLPPPAAEVSAAPVLAPEPVPASRPAAEPAPSAKPEAVPSIPGMRLTETPASPAEAAATPAPAASEMPRTGAGVVGPAASSLSSTPTTPKTTLLPEQQQRIDEIARLQDEERRRAPTVPGQPRVEDFTADARNQTVTQIDISRAPSPAEARPIRAIPVPEDFTELGKREWSPQRKYWAAAATCHLPLYFQDPMLERYGHSAETYFGRAGRFLTYPVDDPRQTTQRNQLIQPGFSVGLMAWQIMTLPYALVVDPPWEAQYDLGYWRPGDKIPTDMYYQPLYGTGPPLRGKKY